MSPEPTPDPDPDPDPDPEPQYNLTVNNSQNTSYMVRVYATVDNSQVPIAGGVSSIITPLEISFDFPTDGIVDTSKYMLKTRTYNNSYPDWTDSYYDSSNQVAIMVNGVGKEFIQTSAGSDVVCTIQDSYTVVLNSQS